MAKMASPSDVRLATPFPLHRGPFLFGPRFLSASDWFQEFRLLTGLVLTQCQIVGKIVQPSDGRLALIEIGGVELMLDGAGGIFTVRKLGYWDSDEDDFSHWLGPSGTPEQFLTQLDDQANIDLLGSDYESVRAFSSLLFSYMGTRFERALREGLGQLTAHIDSPFSPSTALEFWQLRYLKIVEMDREKYLLEDLDLDEAIGHGGRNIYGLGVVPLGYSTTATTRDKSDGKVAGRGRKRSVDYALLDEVMLNLLRRKGIPSKHTPKWTGEIFAKTVITELGERAPSRATILNNLPPIKDRFRKERSRTDNQQSNNSKIQST